MIDFEVMHLPTFGHYQQCTSKGQFLFTSGQLPVDPNTGGLITAKPKEIAHRVLSNLEHILLMNGSRKELILQVSVYLADLQSAWDVDSAFSEFFGPTHKPARTIVGVAHLPLGALMEMDAIAWIPGSERQSGLPLDG